MIHVSREFKNKIYGQERLINSNVSFEIIDVDAYEDASIQGSWPAEISRREQVLNRRRVMSHKYATLEPYYFLLDGTYHIPPKPTDEGGEVGFWDEQFSGASGSYSIPPWIEFNFSKPHTSMGITIAFDQLTNEYASDFILDVYDSAGGLITSENVTGNTKAIYVLEKPLTGYQRVVLNIMKWNKGDRRARIVEVDFGLVQEYSGEKLISLRLVEEVDLLASTVPSSEMSFTLDNSDNLFNLLNPNGIYHYLKPNQLMSANLGLQLDENRYEYINMGRYYLNEWTVEEGGMTSTFIGRDIFTRLEAINYTRLKQNTNLYDLAVDVFDQANVVDYWIHENLKYVTTNGFKEAIKVREALQMIAIAGEAVIKQDRTGRVVIDRIEALEFETGYLTWTGMDEYAGMTTPFVSQDYSHQAITFENAYNTPQVKLATAVTHLVFRIHPTTGDPYEYKIINSQVKSGQGFEISNPLINTETHALEVSEYMFREYSFIAEYLVNWRQNPALESGDIVSIEDSFGSKKKARITKTEFNYAGYLDGTTEAKGGI